MTSFRRSPRTAPTGRRSEYGCLDARSGRKPIPVAIALVEYLAGIHSQRAIQIFATDLRDAASSARASGSIPRASKPMSVQSDCAVSSSNRSAPTASPRQFEKCACSRAKCHRGPALLTCRSHLVPQRVDLHVRSAPGTLTADFHFALNRGGYLVLGIAETVGPSSDLFGTHQSEPQNLSPKEALHRPQLTFMSDAWLAGTPPADPRRAGHRPGDLQRKPSACC